MFCLKHCHPAKGVISLHKWAYLTGWEWKGLLCSDDKLPDMIDNSVFPFSKYQNHRKTSASESYKWVNSSPSSFKVPSRWTQQGERPRVGRRANPCCRDTAFCSRCSQHWEFLPPAPRVQIPPGFQAGVTAASPEGPHPWLQTKPPGGALQYQFWSLRQ